MNSNNRFGVMIDLSRNAVMKVSELKEYIKTVKALGYNGVWLYTEDTFEVEGEEYFGYLRGRYTQNELKEIDEFCSSEGVELIPCVQTLAHLNAIFRWKEYADIQDVNDILLVENERAYKLIDNIFKTVKKNFSSKIVHIGMDEAHLVGLGNFLDENGYKDRFGLLINHLNKVMEIARSYGLEPIMWSDMFFRLINKGDYYLEGDTKVEMVDEIKDKIPKDVGLVYWDYYNTEYEMYDKMIKAHARMSDNVWFAGGAWTWRGFSPSNSYTLRTMELAMRACRNNGVKDIVITMWGDDGSECSKYAVLPSLYATKRFYDGETDIEKIKKEFNEITGENFDKMSSLDLVGYAGAVDLREVANAGKYLLYNDLFCGYFDVTVPDNASEFYKNTASLLRENKKGSKYEYIFNTLEKLCDVLFVKARLGIEIRSAYQNKDKKGLKCAVKKIDQTIKRLKEFYCAFKSQWNKENKPFGFDVQDIRLGGLEKRLISCRERLLDYVSGKTSEIEELNEKLLAYPTQADGKKGALCFNNWIKTASVNSVYHMQV